MYAEFGIERELNNQLFYKECENDNGHIHFHSQIELCIVDEGEMDILLNDKKKTLKKGEMCISLSYDAHVYNPVKYSKSTVIVIPSHMCEEFISGIKNKKVVNPFISDIQTVNEIKSYFNKLKNTDNHIKQIGYINLILGNIMEAVSFEQTSDPIETELSSKMLFYIHENYKSDITLSALSSKFGYTESYISRYFRSRFHIGINQYLSIIRLKNAIMLMRKHKNNITFCALESGFNSVRTFYRVFYNEFNCSPKEYLRQYH